MHSKVELQDFVLRSTVSLVACNCAFFAAYYLSFNDSFTTREAAPDASYKTLLVIVNLLSLIISFVRTNHYKQEFINYSLFLLSYTSLIVFIQGYQFSRAFHLYFFVLFSAFTLFVRYSRITQSLEKHLFHKGLERKVVVIGDELNAFVLHYLNDRPGNYKCVAILSDDALQKRKLNGLRSGGLNEVETILSQDSIDEVLIATSQLTGSKIDKIVKITEKYHATAKILPPYFDFLANQNCHVEYWMGVPTISVFHSGLSLKYNQFIKRAFDVFVSLIFIAAVFPVLFLIVGPAIWLTNRGPIFFKQWRKGYRQKPFICYKFRTMKIESAGAEIVQAQRQDPRVTVVGRSLRKTSIDEVPQFFNVLLGNMSLVGPRPHMVEHDEIYEKSITRYNVRFVAKPGITGWAQVNGYRGGTEDPSLMQKRIEHDLWYIKNWSIWLDIKIIVWTTSKLLFGDNKAY